MFENDTSLLYESCTFVQDCVSLQCRHVQDCVSLSVNKGKVNARLGEANAACAGLCKPSVDQREVSAGL